MELDDLKTLASDRSSRHKLCLDSIKTFELSMKHFRHIDTVKEKRRLWKEGDNWWLHV